MNSTGDRSLRTYCVTRGACDFAYAALAFAKESCAEGVYLADRARRWFRWATILGVRHV